MADKKKHVLKTRGITKKGSGIKKSKHTYDADDLKRHQPTMEDVGIGSAKTLGRLRIDAAAVKAEKKIPGNLGYQTNLGPQTKHAKSALEKGKNMLTDGKKKKKE